MDQSLDRARIVDLQFLEKVAAKDFPKARSVLSLNEAKLDPAQFLSLFESQIMSRHLDLKARQLREQLAAFYTIGSSGHEANAAVALALRPTDLAFLHYRSTSFMLQRSKQAACKDYLFDHLLALVASSDDPISGGRHKVLGSYALNVPPQTSTIASHLPKSLGAAFGLGRAAALSHQNKFPKDSLVLCSFGDASINHASALCALNASEWLVDHGLRVPIIFLCEDNGLGISVPTASHWIEKVYSQRPYLSYLSCDALNLADVFKVSTQAAALARAGKPVLMHFKTVRLLGHAGSDIESQYRSQEEIDQAEANDPLLHSARICIEENLLSNIEILALYEQVRAQVSQAAIEAVKRPKLSSAAQIMSAIIPPKLALKQSITPAASKNIEVRTMAQCINQALGELLAQYSQILLFGEDVGRKGGVYRITAGLQARFGSKRVFDTLLDEQTILGTAIGVAHIGFLPMPEIQFLAYTNNAADQIRGEAATLSFFSNGQFTNPMVIRIPSLAYQKGFGGHFHNDNAITFLREIPGIIICCPSRPADAACLLKEAVRLALEEQRVVIFLEPIALYMTKDLISKADNNFLEAYPNSDPDRTSLGYLEVHQEGQGELAIISYANGAYLSRQAVTELTAEGIACRLIDLRYLHPLPEKSLLAALVGVKAILIVDECRKTGSLSEALITLLLENNLGHLAIKRICAEDSFIPLGDASRYVLPSKERIYITAKKLSKSIS